jgi:hypothetical protein
MKNTTYIFSIISSTTIAPGRSLLFPNTNNGMLARLGLANKSCSSFLADSSWDESAESTTKLN